MRMIRSLCYMGLAGLAMFVTTLAVSHSRDFSYEPVVTVIEAIDFDTLDALFIRPAFVEAVITAIPGVDRNLHTEIYMAQNQPGTHWRFSADAYRLIDPDIALT